MRHEHKDFPEFATGVSLGLYRAILTDIDVFLLFVGATLRGSRNARLRQYGVTLLLYVMIRRADQYAGLIASKLGEIADVINNPLKRGLI